MLGRSCGFRYGTKTPSAPFPCASHRIFHEFVVVGIRPVVSSAEVAHLTRKRNPAIA